MMAYKCRPKTVDLAGYLSLKTTVATLVLFEEGRGSLRIF